MKKVIIIPSFASSHILGHWIENIQQTIEPTLIIIRESLFKNGPENKGNIGSDFVKKWTYKGQGVVGFDWEHTQRICSVYDNVVLTTYENKEDDVNNTFLKIVSDGLDGFLETGTIVFVLEPDAFLLEADKDIIQEEIARLKPGEGLKCLWRDFLETQYYCEAINEVSPKVRRFCYCFDNMENYKKAMDGFMSQSYPLLQYTDKFWVRHYPWFVYDKWKELRYELIYRSDPQYWKDFEVGLREIRKMSEEESCIRSLDLYTYADIFGHEKNRDRITIRPLRSDEARWAKFIDVEHPKAIKNHPNYITTS